jgi:hypothetical protein
VICLGCTGSDDDWLVVNHRLGLGLEDPQGPAEQRDRSGSRLAPNSNRIAKTIRMSSGVPNLMS